MPPSNPRLFWPAFRERSAGCKGRSARAGKKGRVYVALLLATALITFSSAPASAQTLLGTVLAEGRNTGISGAMVSLLDQSGARRAGAMSDSLGRFRLVPPERGEYVVEAVRIGYATTRSPLFSLEVSGTVALEIAMNPLPIGIAGFEVSGEREAEQMLGLFGVTPAQLGGRWISRHDIEKMPLLSSPRDAIRWRNIAGVSIKEDIPNVDEPPSLCVMIRQMGCAPIYLDGMRIPRYIALGINPYDLEGIAILRPLEASLFYGTDSSSTGVVLMWTRSGRR